MMRETLEIAQMKKRNKGLSAKNPIYLGIADYQHDSTDATSLVPDYKHLLMEGLPKQALRAIKKNDSLHQSYPVKVTKPLCQKARAPAASPALIPDIQIYDWSRILA